MHKVNKALVQRTLMNKILSWKILIFDQLSQHLIEGAASANGDKDVGDAIDDVDEPSPTVTQAVPPPVRFTITIPPSTLVNCSAHHTPVKVSIPLRTLFKYPMAPDVDIPPSDGKNTFWSGRYSELGKGNGSL